jgi:hypothetical protein
MMGMPVGSLAAAVGLPVIVGMPVGSDDTAAPVLLMLTAALDVDDSGGRADGFSVVEAGAAEGCDDGGDDAWPATLEGLEAAFGGLLDAGAGSEVTLEAVMAGTARRAKAPQNANGRIVAVRESTLSQSADV